MRVTGKNFIPPPVREKEEEEIFDEIIDVIHDVGIAYEDDSDPYEDKLNYTPEDPKYPDRRWRSRVRDCENFVPRKTEEEMDTEMWGEEDLPMMRCEGLPQSFPAEKFTRTGYQIMLRRQKEKWQHLDFDEDFTSTVSDDEAIAAAAEQAEEL